MKSINKYLAPVLLAAAIILGGCAGGDGASTDDAADESSRAVRVETLELQPRVFEEVVEVTGSVEASEDAVLSAQASGTLTALAELGRFVQEGELVAQLDPRTAQAAVRQAEAQVESARSSSELAADNLRRNEPLYQDSIISAIEYENVRAQANQARANLAQAEASLAQAQEQLRNTRITAPFSGTVEERFARRGEQVSPGQQVVRIVSTSRVNVRAGVPERYAGDISAGTPVSVNLSAYGSASRIPARVTFVGGAVDPQSRTFPVEVEIPNTSGQIKPEMVATVYITRSSIPDVLVVPRPALIREETGYMLYVVDRSGETIRAERRSVITGSSYANEVVIESGLQPGDEVVVLGQNNVSQGDPLNVIEVHQSVETATDPVEEDLEALPPA